MFGEEPVVTQQGEQSISIDAAGREVLLLDPGEHSSYVNVGARYSRVQIATKTDGQSVSLECGEHVSQLIFEGNFQRVNLVVPKDTKFSIRGLKTAELDLTGGCITDATGCSISRFCATKSRLARPAQLIVGSFFPVQSQKEWEPLFKIDGRFTTDYTVINHLCTGVEINGSAELGTVTSYEPDRSVNRTLFIAGNGDVVNVKNVDTCLTLDTYCRVLRLERVCPDARSQKPIKFNGKSLVEFVDCSMIDCEFGTSKQPIAVELSTLTQIRNASGFIRDLRAYPGSVIVGRSVRTSNLSILSVEQADHAELHNVNLKDCDYQSLERLRTAERVFPLLPNPVGHSLRLWFSDIAARIRPITRIRELYRMAELPDPPPVSRAKRCLAKWAHARFLGQFWTRPKQERRDLRSAQLNRWDRIRLIGEDTRIPGRAQSRIRFFYKQARRRNAGISTERLLLMADGLFGYGERVWQPIIVFAICCALVAAGAHHSMVAHIHAVNLNMRHFWDRFKYLAESPLTAVHAIDDAQYKSHVGSVGIVSALRLFGFVILAITVLAGKRQIDPLKK